MKEISWSEFELLKLRIGSLLLIFLILMSCSGNSNNQVVHPVKEKLPRITSENNIIDIASFEDVKGSEDFLSGFTLITELNIKDELFADAVTVNAKVDHKGNTYFVNLDKTSISVFDKSGRQKYSFGREGRGPGDFEDIKDIAVSDSLLVVLDNLEIDVYTLKSDMPEYQNSFIHGLTLSKEICFAPENRIILNGGLIDKRELEDLNRNDLLGSEDIRQINNSAGIPLHIFDMETQKIKQSMGFSYSSESNWPAFSVIMADSRIACNESMDIMINLNTNFGYITAYNFLGDELWVSKISGYWMRKFTETLKPIPTLEPNYDDSPKTTLVHSLNYISEQKVLLQLKPVYHNISSIESSIQESNQLYSILIDSRTGELSPVFKSQNEVILDINSDFMLTKRSSQKGNNYYLHERSLNSEY